MDLIAAENKLRQALLSRINAVPEDKRPPLYEATGRLTTIIGVIRALQARASIQAQDMEGAASLCGAALLDAADSLKEIFYDDIDAFEEALSALTRVPVVVRTGSPAPVLRP